MNHTPRITSLGLSAAIAIAFAVLGPVSAHAGCFGTRAPAAARPMITLPAITPRKAESDLAARNIVGTWLSTGFDSNGAETSQSYVQWHSDGTEWENVNLPISDPMCLGSWKEVDRKHVSRNHFGWLFGDGGLSGYFNETETVTVGKDGTYHGVSDTKVYDLSGNLVGESTGTTSAVKISP